MTKIPFDLRPATIHDKDFMMHLEKVTWVKFLEEDPENEIGMMNIQKHIMKNLLGLSMCPLLNI